MAGLHTRFGPWLATCIAALSLGLRPLAASEQRQLRVCADPSNLPSSDDAEAGFDNRIVRLIAADLDAAVTYAWAAERRGFLRRTLQAGTCDLVMSVPDGLATLATARSYDRSSYAFVTRSDGPALTGLDDPALQHLRIGLPVLGAEGANTPPAHALGRRGLAPNITGYSVRAETEDVSPSARIVSAVAAGEIDVAILWGPIAGYFARRHGPGLIVRPTGADPRAPEFKFDYAMAIWVRRDDPALLEELNASLDRHRDDIGRILSDYGVPQTSPGGRTDPP